MKTLCDSVADLAKERCMDLVPNATFVCTTFTKIFGLFAKCHALYDSSKALTDADLSELGKLIQLKIQYNIPTFREENRRLPRLLSGLISTCHNHPQTPHAGGSCCPFPPEVEGWIWVSR